MASFVFSTNETSTREEPESACQNITNIVDKKGSYNERAALYKMPIKKDNIKLKLDFSDTPQEIRRQNILQQQKKNRDEAVNAKRGLLKDVFNSENEEEIDHEEEYVDMEVDPVKTKFYRVAKKYKNLLMLSEWMLEVPEDFTEKWIMVPCPEGKRSFVVAYKGSTKWFTKQGNFVTKFKSALPGGNQKQGKNNCTILDCIWDKEKKMFYILDVLTWSKQELLDCETECRFFWLKSQMAELDKIGEIRKGYNDYPFELLPNVSCDTDLKGSLESIVTSMKLDGLLFYHKETHYTGGQTPLVVWLKPYMLPEVLGMNVPVPYDEKPSDYIDFEHHVLQEKDKIKKRQQRDKRQSKSDHEDMEYH